MLDLYAIHAFSYTSVTYIINYMLVYGDSTCTIVCSMKQGFNISIVYS